MTTITKDRQVADAFRLAKKIKERGIKKMKSQNLYFMEKIASDRIEEKEQQKINIINRIEYYKEIGKSTTELEEKLKRIKEYLEIAKK